MHIAINPHKIVYWKWDVPVFDLITKVPRVFRFLDGAESDMLPDDFLITKNPLEMTGRAVLGIDTVPARVGLL